MALHDEWIMKMWFVRTVDWNIGFWTDSGTSKRIEKMDKINFIYSWTVVWTTVLNRTDDGMQKLYSDSEYIDESSF